MIEVQDLEKRFCDVPAVNNLSFTAPDGYITGLLGANGVGKTTTLRMICGVLKPDAGSVRIDDVPASNDGLGLRRRVGALLDHTGLYPRLTAREHLVYFGRLHGMSPACLSKRIDQVLSLLGLERVADRHTAGFSQGERMKIALGRALIHSPRNLVLDEPTNGLDVPSVRALRDLLISMRESGMCIILSSHVLNEIRALCNQVVVISKGSLVAQGCPEDLCRQSGSASLEDAFVTLTSPKENIECLHNR
jgi:sodium transport system ATP-binding protein